MDHDPDKKSRRAPRRLENNGYISKTEVKPEEIKNDTKEFDLSLITRRPIRAASPFATSEKLMTPISHYKSNSAYNSPLTDRNQSAEDRVAEIEVKLLNLKFDKEKLQEFQHNLKANPDNR